MKFHLLVLCALLGLSSIAQKPKITWGEEFKLKKGSTDLEVIHADKNGVYLQEGHMVMKSYFVIGASMRTSGTLVKLDKNLSEVFRNDYNKELRGKEFEQFFVLQGKIYVFASDYEKREKTLNILAAEIDKNSGELTSDWVAVTAFQKEDKKDDISFKLSLSEDSTKLIITSTVVGKERNEYSVQEFDKNLKASAKPVALSNEFDPKTFQLEDLLYTNNRKIILVGRVYEFQEGKKKKDKFLDFANYNIRVYDEKGKQLREINTNVNGRWLMSTKLVQEKNNDLVLAAFYSNAKKGQSIDGMLVQRINPATGDILSTSEKAINHSLLNANTEQANVDDDEKESKAERKEREKLDKLVDEGEAFSKYMRFRNIFYTADNGLVIVAEKYHRYTQTTSSYSPGINGGPGRWTTTTYSVYECGDMMLCKVDKAGDIGWMRIVPKAQREVIQVGYSSGFSTVGFFDASNRPYYAGFGAVQTKDAIHLFFNDNPKNVDVTQPGQKVKQTVRFAKSDCFIVKVDLTDGKAERRFFYSNGDVPTSMPRHNSLLGQDMFIVGKEDRVLGKTKIAVAKISLAP